MLIISFIYLKILAKDMQIGSWMKLFEYFLIKLTFSYVVCNLISKDAII